MSNFSLVIISFLLILTPAFLYKAEESDEDFDSPKDLHRSNRDEVETTDAPTDSNNDMTFGGWDISKACYDPKDQTTHKIDETWSTGGCDLFECKKIKLVNIRNTEVAVSAMKGCASPGRNLPYCTSLPKTTDTYPVCCPLEVCILGNEVNVTGSTPEGAQFNVSKIMTNRDIENITKLSRRELLDYALTESGYFKVKH